MMKANVSASVTCTLNAEDIVKLVEEGELSSNGVVIGTTDPELERVKELLDE